VFTFADVLDTSTLKKLRARNGKDVRVKWTPKGRSRRRRGRQAAHSGRGEAQAAAAADATEATAAAAAAGSPRNSRSSRNSRSPAATIGFGTTATVSSTDTVAL